MSQRTFSLEATVDGDEIICRGEWDGQKLLFSAKFQDIDPLYDGEIYIYNKNSASEAAYKTAFALQDFRKETGQYLFSSISDTASIFLNAIRAIAFKCIPANMLPQYVGTVNNTGLWVCAQQYAAFSINDRFLPIIMDGKFSDWRDFTRDQEKFIDTMADHYGDEGSINTFLEHLQSVAEELITLANACHRAEKHHSDPPKNKLLQEPKTRSAQFRHHFWLEQHGNITVIEFIGIRQWIETDNPTDYEEWVSNYLAAFTFLSEEERKSYAQALTPLIKNLAAGKDAVKKESAKAETR